MESMRVRVWSAIPKVLLLGAAGHALADPSSPVTLQHRSFVIRSASMAPTLIVGDYVYADMKPAAALRLGELVVVAVRNDVWIKRIVALPGDRIAIHKGQVILNGKAVALRPNGGFAIAGENNLPATRARKLIEQFPGEPHPHEILDQMKTAQDEMAEVWLAPGQFFLLGDNRDNSLDSRMADGPLGGLGVVARQRILGRVLYRYWRGSGDHEHVDF